MSTERKLDKNLVLNVLNYWYSFDFLNQSSLQTELNRREQDMLELAKQREGNRQIHSVTCRDPYLAEEKLGMKLHLLLKERHMNCCGNITVYLGSVSKNYCIKAILDAIGGEPQREASLSKLAVASIQLTPEGAYIPNTFSLSPVLWSLNRILLSNGKIIPGMISKEIYDDENHQFEDRLLGMKCISEHETLKRITDDLIKRYVAVDGVVPETAKASNEINLECRMYKNEQEREKRDGDYYGLAHNYYASDLDMLINEVDNLHKVGQKSMKQMLMYYIQAAFDKDRGVDIDRKDLLGALGETDRDLQYRILSEILDIRRAPLGKWPSKYSPFLMQQVAINLAVDEKHDAGTVLEDNGRMFSVNGAPGTGKTTMMKEIIANNVVARARIMATINDPDDVFEKCCFEHGPNPKDKSYTNFNKNYYRIKPGSKYERLADYGIIVTSNNNAAVENITAVIPDLDSILVEMDPDDCDDKAYANTLCEVAALFNPLNGREEQKIETDWERNVTETVTYNDLYFTPYSDKLLRRRTWGLISAPLGSRGKVNRFYKEVLQPMGFGPFNNKKDLGNTADTRKATYRKAVSDFAIQYRKVEKMRDEIAAYIDSHKDSGFSERYHGDGMNRFSVFSREVFDEFIDDNAAGNLEAHMMSPWCSEAYNREREKLFYYAMILNKEFVMASRACRSNLNLLGVAWHVNLKAREYYNNEVVSMRIADLENCMKPMLQTLQLLVPVISTTFASVGTFFRFVKDPDSIGTVIIDEAGQAAPQAALGALWRAHKTIIVGDPKQIEPVVSDDVSLLRTAYGEDVFRCYSDNTLSVQSFADYLNPYGAYMSAEDGGDEAKMWIGSPLTVHRRCISPMYDIANQISYDGTMRQVTPEPSADVTDSLSIAKTEWINVSGVENGNDDHFVKAQGDKVLEMIEDSFRQYYEKHAAIMEVVNEEDDDIDEETGMKDVIAGPDLFIISPFNTVVEGLTQYIIQNLSTPLYPCLNKHQEEVEDWLTDWRNVHIGTVHKFQGREANEVIMVLGCDRNSRYSANWVKKNIVNVAATRAKYRFAIIGDAYAWEDCSPMMQAKRILDSFNI